MSYDLISRSDESYTAKLFRKDVHNMIETLPYIRANASTGFILEKDSKVYMEIDVELVSEEGDVLEWGEEPSEEVNCISYHIPYAYEHGRDESIHVALEISKRVGWVLYDCQEDSILPLRPQHESGKEND